MARPHMSDQPSAAHARQISLELLPATVRGVSRRRESQHIMRALRASPGSDLAAVAATVGVSRRSALKALQQPAGRGGCDTALGEAFVGMDAGRRAAALTVSRVCPPRLARLEAQTRIGAGRGIVWGAASWSGRTRFHTGAPRCVLIEASATRGSGPRKDAAAHRSFPPAALVRVADDPQPAVRAAAGANPAAEVGMLNLLAEDPSDSPCTAAIRNRRCPQWMLARLADHPNPEIREHVAANASANTEVLAKLAADTVIRLKEFKSDLSGDERSRWTAQQQLRRIQVEMAHNPSCPPSVMHGIAKRADPGVRATLASACRDDPELLELLTSYNEGVVDQRVAQNPTCGPELLKELVARAHRYPEMGSWVCETVAKNPNSPPDLLADFASSEHHPKLRSAALRNPNCPPETLQRSARSNDPQTLTDVAANLNCGPGLLRQMISGPGTHALAVAVASNPNSPPDLLNATAVGPYEHSVVANLASNPMCPPELLNALAASGNPYQRAAVAANPGCGLRILAALSSDRDDDTKTAARNALRNLSRQTRGIAEITDAGTTTSDLEL